MTGSKHWIQLKPGMLVIAGELSQDTIASFEHELALLPVLPSQLSVDLSGFEIADGASAVAAVNAMRALAQCRQLTLHEAPQLLAHNLYRVAALEEGNISLQSMREDEPYG